MQFARKYRENSFAQSRNQHQHVSGKVLCVKGFQVKGYALQKQDADYGHENADDATSFQLFAQDKVSEDGRQGRGRAGDDTGFGGRRHAHADNHKNTIEEDAHESLYKKDLPAFKA